MQPRTEKDNHGVYCVTILVFLAALVQLGVAEDEERREALVTILVFLAALVQLRQLRSSSGSGSSYNPCFSGSSSATEDQAGRYSGSDYVTILVFLAALVQRSKK